MSSVINKRPAAKRDLVDVFHHYIGKKTIKTARRFLVQTEATFERLAKMPSLGARYDPADPSHAETRYMPVSRFRMYVIYYRPIPGGIDVLRVLHGARDIESALGAELQ